MSQPPLVFDTTCLSHFALIERLDVLGDLLTTRRCSTTALVKQEISGGAEMYPQLRSALELPWLEVVELTEFGHIQLFVKWTRLIGAAERDLGEASVFAAAEVVNGLAITDDRQATKVGRAHGLEVHGTVWLLAQFCREGKLSEIGAGNLVDMLCASNLRLPCSGAEFGSFARRHGIL